MTSPDFDTLRQKYQAAGQQHVFDFWDTLNDSDKSSLLKQLASIDPAEITAIADSCIVNAPSGHDDKKSAPCTVAELPSQATASIVEHNEEKSKWYDLGLDLISQNKVAVVLLAGGQGTRLGSSAPKGCYDVGLPSKSTLFQLQAERIKKIAELAAARSSGTTPSIPWYIMTSGPTRKVTEEFFEENSYFGLSQKDVIFFEQGTLPCLTGEGKIILSGPSEVAVAPDGNGGVYGALLKNGILDDIKKRGVEHIHTYCVDNCLVKVADPVFIGFSAERKVKIATKVVRKRDATESVGLIVSKNSHPAVLEYSEIDPELASATTADGLLKLRAANIVNHYYSADFLLGIGNWKSTYLPFHIAHKKIPYADLKTGQQVKPSEPNGYKLEQFVFDVFPNLTFNEFASLEVERSSEFSPLKNAPGSSNDNPETSRKDLLNQSKRWLIEAGALIKDDQEVEVRPAASYGGEGLEKYKGKAVTSLVVEN